MYDYIYIPPSDPGYMMYTLDDHGEVYVDGVLVDDTNRLPQIGKVLIPKGIHLVAFRVFNIGPTHPENPCGVGANFSNERSDASAWKCSDQFRAGWNQIEFDDSSWSVCPGGAAVSCGTSPYYFRKIIDL